MARQRNGIADAIVARAAALQPTLKPAADAEQVTRRQEGDTLEARSTSRRIKTVEDLLAHIEADMTRYEIAASEATKWEVGCSDGDGGTTVTELHRVFVRLRPKAGPKITEAVEAMIAAATRDIRRPAVKGNSKAKPGLWQVLVVSDTHFGNYSWKATSGADWDLAIAERVVRDTGHELLAVGDSHKPTRRTIAFLGDLFHYDRAERAETSSGTLLERDGRLQKMLDVGVGTLLGLVERSAETVPTDVLLVHGNHDETLSWVFHRLLLERYRNDKRVTIEGNYTGRKYLSHGRNLLGFAHGHKAKKKLPQLMAIEAASQWAACPYREYHTGHFHSTAAEWSRPIETIDGVLVRTAPSLCVADDWHASLGFLNARQAMETFIYANDGGMIATHVAGPRKETT
jgi:UDP-2,3-diacylglucosamine pyrophosphatase LpxH